MPRALSPQPRADVQMRLGIFGGTFNPVHLGHLLLAETAREMLALEPVVFIPTNQPPHKSARDLLPGAERLKLIELAIRDQSAFVASDIELEREGTSYTIDTVKALHRQLPGAKLFLLIGEDMLGVRWLAWNEVKRLCTVVVAHLTHEDPLRRQASGIDVDRCAETAFELMRLRDSMEQFVSPRLVASLAREKWLSLTAV